MRVTKAKRLVPLGAQKPCLAKWPPLSQCPPLSKGGRPARALSGMAFSCGESTVSGIQPIHIWMQGGGGKRRSEDQFDVALAAEPHRPNLNEEPLKSDKAACHRAMEEWVEMWGGAPLMIEERRAQWWKQAKKQHSRLVKAARAQYEYGTQPTQSLPAADASGLQEDAVQPHREAAEPPATDDGVGEMSAKHFEGGSAASPPAHLGTLESTSAADSICLPPPALATNAAVATAATATSGAPGAAQRPAPLVARRPIVGRKARTGSEAPRHRHAVGGGRSGTCISAAQGAGVDSWRVARGAGGHCRVLTPAGRRDRVGGGAP